MEASYGNHPVRVALTDESPSAEGSSREALDHARRWFP